MPVTASFSNSSRHVRSNLVIGTVDPTTASAANRTYRASHPPSTAMTEPCT